jgi:hypothetical protein
MTNLSLQAIINRSALKKPTLNDLHLERTGFLVEKKDLTRSGKGLACNSVTERQPDCRKPREPRWAPN